MLGVNYQPRGGGYLYSNISQSYSQCGPDWVLKSSGPKYESDQETRGPLTSHLSPLTTLPGGWPWPGRSLSCRDCSDCAHHTITPPTLGVRCGAVQPWTQDRNNQRETRDLPNK